MIDDKVYEPMSVMIVLINYGTVCGMVHAILMDMNDKNHYN